ncbi:hypothetical protein Tco_0564223 [Tanacetum coccineum]
MGEERVLWSNQFNFQGEVVYTWYRRVSTSLCIVCVKYSASYRSSIIWCGWLLLLLLCFSSTVLHLLLFLGSYITVPESAQDTDIGLGES